VELYIHSSIRLHGVELVNRKENSTLFPIMQVVTYVCGDVERNMPC
jgi:hypothetical protein